MCHIRIVDSFGFLLSGLEKNTDALKAKHPDNPKLSFPSTYRFLSKYAKCTDEQITLALQKNAYPYLWFTSFDKFNRPITDLDELFDNNRYEAFTEDISDAFKQKFERMKGVYYAVRDAFGFTTVKAYCELYVCMDVLQLCDGMDFLRGLFIGTHKIDPYGSYGISNYTMKAFEYHIKDSKHKPELFRDGEMNKYCMFKQGNSWWDGWSDAERGCGEQ